MGRSGHRAGRAGKLNYRMVFFFLIITAAHLALAADVNILVNPGFEMGTLGWAPRNCTITAEMSQRRSGAACARVSGRTANWNGIKQSVLDKMQPGQTYHISGWVKLENAAQDNVYISVEQRDGGGTRYIRVQSGVGNDSAWTELSGSFTLNTTGTLTVLDVYFEGPASGVDFLVDDVVAFGPGPQGPVADVSAAAQVNPSIRHQVLDGFGASGGWYENWITRHPHKDRLYDIMFGELGLDIYRVRNPYDQPDGDVYIANTVEICRRAEQSLGRSVNVMISSWSPPATLKSNGDLENGGTLLKDAQGKYMYAEFAQWWRDSLDYWISLGVTPAYVSIQNEPDYEASWESCKFGHNERSTCAGYPQALTAFLAAISDLPNPPKIIGPETIGITPAMQYINQLKLEQPASCDALYAYASHLYNDGGVDNPDSFLNNMQAFHNGFNDKPIMMTEFSKGTSATLTHTDAMGLARLIHNAMVVQGASSYLYWELFWEYPKGLVALTWDGYMINPVYFAMKHFSAFTEPLWRRIDVSVGSPDIRMSAYVCPDDNRITIVAINLSTVSNIGLNVSGLGDFGVTGGKVYRTSQFEFCELVGDYAPQTEVVLPKNSITTLALTTTPQTCRQVQEWGYRLAGDLDGDCAVNLNDAAVLAEFWLADDCEVSARCREADLTSDGKVDIDDLIVFVEQWLHNNDPQR